MIRNGAILGACLLLAAAAAVPLAASAGSEHGRHHRVNHYHDVPRHGWPAPPAPSHKDRKRLDAAYGKWHREHVRVYGYAPHPCRNYGPPRHGHGRR
jgi:hypothetical protein